MDSVAELIGKELLFPENVTFETINKKKINYDCNTPFKIFTYIDSIGCTSCRLRLHEWEHYIERMDSLHNGKVCFIVCIYPKSYDYVTRLLRVNNFRHPVIIDINNEFNSLNKFPKDFNLQTFLLNKSNKVLAVGNPILNDKISSLYEKIIMGYNNDSKLTETKESPLILTSKNYDKIIKITKRRTSISLKNISKKNLIIHDVSTSCNCISITYPKRILTPDEIFSLEIYHNKDNSAYFKKSITIYTNINPPFTFWVEGTKIKKNEK